MSEIDALAEEVRSKIRQSKGWWTKISQESAVPVPTISRFAAGEEGYSPRLDHVIALEKWLSENGVKRVGPQGKLPEELAEFRRQTDIEDAIRSARQ